MRASLVLWLTVGLVSACNRTDPAPSATTATAEPAPVASTPTATPPPAPTTIEAKTIGEALKVAHPVNVSPDDAPDRGIFRFAQWASGHLSWADVGVAKNETSLALVMKDSDPERGKALCVSGRLVEIGAIPRTSPKIFDGIMVNNAREYFSFLAVRSTGDLVERRPARFCGLVMGRHSYKNSGGGVTHAVRLVGMFDLPENRAAGAATAPAPSGSGTVIRLEDL